MNRAKIIALLNEHEFRSRYQDFRSRYQDSSPAWSDIDRLAEAIGELAGLESPPAKPYEFPRWIEKENSGK